tara:strand:+ start:766 stop:1023 length:258 start_codon:yes stop_codon:yes gene_type:complete
MFSIEFSNVAKKFLKKYDKQLAKRLIKRIERLAVDSFPTDVKRVVNKKEKVFRIRVGGYRIQYSVLYDKNIIFISDIDKRPRAYK